MVLSILVRSSADVLLDSASLNFLDLLNELELDSVGIVDVAVGVGNCDYLSAKGCSLLASVNSNVSGTGDNNGLALEGLAVSFKHFVGEVAETVTCSLCSCERTAVGKTLTCENACELVAESLILTEHIANLTSACTDVTGRNVCVSTDVLAKLSHEALAETHNLSVALTLRIEVGAALAAAHREGCKAVLEYLLKAEELDNTDINGGVKSDTALVRTDCRVELYSETTVYLYLAVVVNPRNTENDLSFRLNESVKNACLNEIGSLVDNGLEGLNNLCNSLNEFGLTLITLLNIFQ